MVAFCKEMSTEIKEQEELLTFLCEDNLQD